MFKSNTRTSERDAPLTGVIAVVGCDGTGKSTLTADLLASLRSKGTTERRYLGTISGEMGDKIKSLPFIGIKLERYLNAKAQRAQDINKKLPGTFSSLVMYLLSWWRALQLLRVRRLSRQGIMVIVDRYPQAEIPGFHFDGPALTAERTNSWLIRKLAAREQKLYEWMAQQKPDLVLRLNIDAETAHSRKSDHNIIELREKISIMPRLNFNGARIIDLDSRVPYAQVLENALQAVNTCIGQETDV